MAFLKSLRELRLRAAACLPAVRCGRPGAIARNPGSPVKAILSLLAVLFLAVSASAQIKAPPAVDPATSVSNALQSAIEKGDTARVTMLSNVLQNMKLRGTAPASPAGPPAVGATPPAIRPVAQPANPVVAPTAPPAGAPPVAGAVAPGGAAGAAGAGGGISPATANAAKAAATTTADPDEIVFQPGMLKLVDADLAQVLDIYQDLTGRTILRPSTLPATAKITLKSQAAFTRREAIQALDSILAMNQVIMIPQGEKFMKALPQAEAFGGAGPFNDLPPELLPDSGTFVTEIVQLKNTTPQDLQQLLTAFAKLPGASIIGIPGANMLILRDLSENVKRMVEIIDRVDVVAIPEFEPVVIPIKYALAADIAQVLSSLTEGGGSTTTVGSSGSSGRGLSGGGFGGGGMSRGGTGGMGGMGGAYGGTGGYGSSMNAMGGATQAGMGGMGGIGGAGGIGGGAGGARNSFQDRLRSIVNRAASGTFAILGQTQIIADERTNSLLIFASKQDLVSISNIINKIDVVVPQVLIEAAIIEVGLNDAQTIGISYLQHPKTAGKWTGAGAILNETTWTDPNSLVTLSTNIASGFSYFLKFNESLDIALKAAANDGRINVLSRPRIQTSHAVEANIFVGETRPYPTGSSYGGVYGSFSQIQQLQIGITLSVLPLINTDGLVSMDIRTRVQNVGEEVTIQGVGNVPTTVDREANAKVAVRDQETIILGGFISDDSNRTKSGVPILKDLPLLGGLFRSSTRRVTRRELLIMLRPTVLPDPQMAATFAQEERSRMPGVVATERMFKEEVDELRKSENIETSKPKSSQPDLFKREGLTK